MKTSQVLATLMLGIGVLARAQAEPIPTQEITIPNFDDTGPPCVVKVPSLSPRCTPDGCNLRAPEKSKLDSITMQFSCLPKSALTGFERPPPETKVHSLTAKNAGGNFSILDDIYSAPNERFRHLLFCLYGKLNNFCVNSIVKSLDYRTKVAATRTVKEFLQAIELRDPQILDGRK